MDDLAEIKQALIMGLGIAVRNAVDTLPLYCTGICIPENPTGRDCKACGRIDRAREAKEEMANEIDRVFKKGD